MSEMEGLADSIYKPLLYQTMLYLPHNIYSQIAFQLLDLGRVPSHRAKWDVMLGGVTSIDVEVALNLH